MSGKIPDVCRKKEKKIQQNESSRFEWYGADKQGGINTCLFYSRELDEHCSENHVQCKRHGKRFDWTPKLMSISNENLYDLQNVLLTFSLCLW